MQITIAENYEALSSQAADRVARRMQAARNKLLCIASGDTPAGMYRQLVARVQAKELDVQDWFFVGLDEWAGMNGSDEGSCRWHLDRQLFGPLKIPENRICFFDGRAADLQKECTRTELFIRD